MDVFAGCLYFIEEFTFRMLNFILHILFYCRGIPKIFENVVIHINGYTGDQLANINFYESS